MPLISRNGHEFQQWPLLNREIARTVQCQSAILDGEVVCLDADGRPNFSALLFRRWAPHFCAFDVLAWNHRDMRALPLLVRKGCLLDVMPSVESRVRYVDHIHEQGAAFFDLACQRDLESIVAKWAHGTYQEGERTSWLKVKNPSYSQMENRHELFEDRGRSMSRRKASRPVLVLA